MSVITLLSDFGTQDGYVAAIHGYVLSQAPDIPLIHASHNIQPQNIWQAAITLNRYARHYPENTIHLVVVDPGVGSERAAMALKCDNHWLVGPNNGVLSLAAKHYKSVTAYRLKSQTRWWSKHQSFDGLALFTPAAVQLALGTDILELADSSTELHQLQSPEPELIANTLVGQILGFDRFGNAITNISASDIPRNQTLVIHCQQLEYPLVSHYCASDAHGRLAIINSDNLVELAVYQSSARQELNLTVGESVSIALEP